ncbi:MAG: DUF2589 domain-containing protein [Marinilabiliaceae bacterium]|nr:DUF2589 domain-containing protein [Marinilabiliaceae bacterium]
METALVSMAQQFTGLPMHALIGAPLNATATANSSMAVTQTKFMMDTCFNKEGTAPAISYKPIMIKMELVRGVIGPPAENGDVTIQNVTTTFNLPLLTVMPINSLAVQTADVTFEMEVKSSYDEEQKNTTTTTVHTEASAETTFDSWLVKATVKGSASYDKVDSSTHNTHYQKSNSAKYTVNVHAGQLPLPKGVNTIIEAFTRAIEPIQMPTGQQPQPQHG